MNSKELGSQAGSPGEKHSLQHGRRQPLGASPTDRRGIDPARTPPPSLHFMVQLMAWKKLASCSPAVT